MKLKYAKLLSIFPVILILQSCFSGGVLTTLGEDYQKSSPETETHWNFSKIGEENLIAHQGSVTNLSHWWKNFNDVTLNAFLTAAQQQSYSIAKAKSNIEQARANLIGANAKSFPMIDSNLGYNRAMFNYGGPSSISRTIEQFDIQSNWEIDLFGGIARQKEANESQLESTILTWHDARVAVAVELANAYVDYRYCENKKTLVSQDLNSRQLSEKLTTISNQAGFNSSSDLALIQANLAQASNTLSQQTAQCEKEIKSLVAMTGLKEIEVRQHLKPIENQTNSLPKPPPFQIDSLPAKVVLQRPDVSAAEREVAYASANIGVAEANRFPKLTITGNIAPAFQSINAGTILFTPTWAIGPTLSLPLFDAGKRFANLQVAKAQYETAVVNFHSVVRTAVKEIEEAQIRLTSVSQQLPQVRANLEHHQKILFNTQELYNAGLSNLIDLESTKHDVLSAEMALQDIEYEKVRAWIALYRAAGGSWT
jgi:NodT family efflux transporter outer membrane factor (OMF) lipoprotein